ncbi:sugar phosphate isomerase/epimerase family protein [Meiothermus granaticius]|uniref:Inosose dehydratase n=1 Tax=Meiothermus granaticius NBRC 107808 TaxID=1227551 RepID=A0A399F6C7_9DEIN|nr:sugar phosphate isomerase/epimerase [Meiothermus granaticius]RIH90819.1 Inosose dehydratase [Meiothermus granaticius NBRC 107808]GEM85944.1 sugar phosphate isomerase [Meiothermus granaticius NBRC 107808]
MHPPIGLQVYSLREALAQDFYGTLEQVAQMGYTGVELFGNLPPIPELKPRLEELGLEVAGRHASLDQLTAGVEPFLEEVRALGAKYLVCAWSKANPTWAQNADSLAELAEHTQRAGLRLLYHNHDHEIREGFAGSTALDYLLSRSEALGAELDIAWLHAGGADPVTYLRRYAARAPLLHLKDVRKGGQGWETVELGMGEVNLKAALAQTTGAEWLLIEQDHSPDPLGSARRNLEWLKRHLG